MASHFSVDRPTLSGSDIAAEVRCTQAGEPTDQPTEARAYLRVKKEGDSDYTINEQHSDALRAVQDESWSLRWSLSNAPLTDGIHYLAAVEVEELGGYGVGGSEQALRFKPDGGSFYEG